MLKKHNRPSPPCEFYCLIKHVQWNPSNMDTIREITFALYKEVSFIQWFLNYDILLICHITARREVNNISQLYDDAVRVLTVN